MRRAEGFAVRRWLQLGAASAGMGAAIWGFSVVGPQTGVAAADTGGTSSASSSASSDGNRSVRSVRAVRSAGDPRRAQRSAATDKDEEKGADPDDESDLVVRLEFD
ncbi:MAG: hypothetical protein U5N53_10255 [Mycobacterium sp.]|nr:hypothetical protein [Mycobacterium sp.]